MKKEVEALRLEDIAKVISDYDYRLGIIHDLATAFKTNDDYAIQKTGGLLMEEMCTIKYDMGKFKITCGSLTEDYEALTDENVRKFLMEYIEKYAIYDIVKGLASTLAKVDLVKVRDSINRLLSKIEEVESDCDP